MGSKKKGTKAERELFHMLWEHFGPTLRSAGSGSTPRPSPDLLASNGKKVLAIECKSTKKRGIYLKKKEVEELKQFCDLFNAEPWVGVRFDNMKWFFMNLEMLKKTKKDYYGISIDSAIKKGLKFEELIGKYKQLRL